LKRDKIGLFKKNGTKLNNQIKYKTLTLTCVTNPDTLIYKHFFLKLRNE